MTTGMRRLRAMYDPAPTIATAVAPPSYTGTLNQQYDQALGYTKPAGMPRRGKNTQGGIYMQAAQTPPHGMTRRG